MSDPKHPPAADLHDAESSLNDARAPRIETVKANGLSHRVLHWGTGVGTPMVLVHGFMDAAGTWDLVAEALVAGGRRVIAMDLRGFGHAPRAPAGSYYHFPDYVPDLAGVLDAVAPEPVDLVGHSMGGAIATYYAGAFPERIRRLAVLEGLGPPEVPFSTAPARMRQWVLDVRAVHAKAASRPMTFDEALARLRVGHPAVPDAVLRTRLPYLVRREGELFVWAFDPLHRTAGPSPFQAAYFRALAAGVTKPVLAVSGGSTGFHPIDEEERLAAFAHLRRATVEGAGHMMHWTEPQALARELLAFFGD
jgi:pimeloyl-ACP methyl ester carboxylesterase